MGCVRQFSRCGTGTHGPRPRAGVERGGDAAETQFTHSVSVKSHVFSKYSSTSARVAVRRFTSDMDAASSMGDEQRGVKERVVSCRRCAPRPGTDTALPSHDEESKDWYVRPKLVDASSTRTRGEAPLMEEPADIV